MAKRPPIKNEDLAITPFSQAPPPPRIMPECFAADSALAQPHSRLHLKNHHSTYTVGAPSLFPAPSTSIMISRQSSPSHPQPQPQPLSLPLPPPHLPSDPQYQPRFAPLPPRLHSLKLHSSTHHPPPPSPLSSSPNSPTHPRASHRRHPRSLALASHHLNPPHLAPPLCLK